MSHYVEKENKGELRKVQEKELGSVSMAVPQGLRRSHKNPWDFSVLIIENRWMVPVARVHSKLYSESVGSSLGLEKEEKKVSDGNRNASNTYFH